MAGKTKRVLDAQEALDAAIREMIEASDEMEREGCVRRGDPEHIEVMGDLQRSVLTHWVVAISRTYWKRDPDDVEDPTEYPTAIVSALGRDDTMAGWMMAGLLRKTAVIVDDYA